MRWVKVAGSRRRVKPALLSVVAAAASANLKWDVRRSDGMAEVRMMDSTEAKPVNPAHAAQAAAASSATTAGAAAANAPASASRGTAGADAPVAAADAGGSPTRRAGQGPDRRKTV